MLYCKFIVRGVVPCAALFLYCAECSAMCHSVKVCCTGSGAMCSTVTLLYWVQCHHTVKLYCTECSAICHTVNFIVQGVVSYAVL